MSHCTIWRTLSGRSFSTSFFSRRKNNACAASSSIPWGSSSLCHSHHNNDSGNFCNLPQICPSWSMIPSWLTRSRGLLTTGVPVSANTYSLPVAIPFVNFVCWVFYIFHAVRFVDNYRLKKGWCMERISRPSMSVFGPFSTSILDTKYFLRSHNSQ